MKLEALWPTVRASAGGILRRLARPATPFDRLLATQAFMLSGSAMVAIALAGSLFFDISPRAARPHVLLGLGLTFVPFVVVAPAIGPLLDSIKGMRKAMVLISALGSLVLCLLMAGELKSLLLFPESFGILVLSKVYGVSKQALVPEVISATEDDSYMRANATLNFTGALSGFAASAIGIAVWKIPGLGSPWVLRVDGLVFLTAALYAWRLPRSGGPSPRRSPRRAGAEAGQVTSTALGDESPATRTATAEAGGVAARRARLGVPAAGANGADPVALKHRGLRVRVARQQMAGLFAAASAMATLRASTGFLEFLLVFTLRREGYSLAWFGVVLGGLTAGSVLANLLAPKIRSHLHEETIVAAALGLVCVSAAAVASIGGMLTQALLMLATALASGTAKVAFDALVQRDSPEEHRGTAFARFETRFQLVWVAGAVVPVAVAFPAEWGDVAMAIAAALAAGAYWSRHTALRRHARRSQALRAPH